MREMNEPIQMECLAHFNRKYLYRKQLSKTMAMAAHR